MSYLILPRPAGSRRHAVWLLGALTLCLAAARPASAQPASTGVEGGVEAEQSAPAELAAPPAVVLEDEAPRAESSPTVTARLGRGVTVQSADDRFALTVRARGQLLFRAISDAPGADDGFASFEIRRARLLFQGHLFGEDWQYYIQLGFSNRDMERDLRLPLRDAYMTYSGIRDLNVRFGQMKVPHDRQRVNSSSALQMVDRSIVTGEFSLDRDVGIQIFSNDLGGKDGRFGYNLGIFGGDGRNRAGADFGLLYAGRLTYLPFGGFDDFVEGDHARVEEPRLALSLAGAINQNSVRYRSTFDGTFTLGSYDYAHAAFDATFRLRGFSALGELFYRDVIGVRSRTDASDPASPIVETSRAGYGYFGQAGYLFNEHFELVGRFGEIRPLPDATTALVRNGELGGGANWYFQRHDFKIQTDYFWLYEDRFDRGQHQVRVQAQFYL